MTHPGYMRRPWRFRALTSVAIATMAAALAGCTTTKVRTVEYPNDTRLRHPIAVKEGTRTFQVLIGSARGSLTPTQRAEVMGLARSWRSEATGGIIIDVPAGTTNEVAASEAYREIQALLAAAGVPHTAVVVRRYQPANPHKLATIKLTYPRMVAEAGPCGLWPEDLGPADDIKHAENRPYYNLGCANQRNLAAMVENPADLVQPRTESSTYTGRRTTAIDKYRQGESPATVYPDASKGTISDLGK